MKKSLIVSVEAVSVDDYQQWLIFWFEYQVFYKVSLSDEATLATWRRFFDENEKMYCAVAKSADSILGFVHYLYHSSTWAVNEYCYLEDLYVTPSARGLQVGKQLIEFVQKQAQKKECARLYWHTQETNSAGQKLYNWIADKPGVIEYRMPL